MSIKEIAPAAERAARVRRILGKSMRRTLNAQGDSLGGFAIVTWDMRGEPSSAYYTEDGPVGRGLMSTFVRDVLNRHVTVVLAEELASEPVRGDSS